MRPEPTRAILLPTTRNGWKYPTFPTRPEATKVKSAASLSAVLRNVRHRWLDDLECDLELTYRENSWKTPNTALRRGYAIDSLEVDWQVIISSESSGVDTGSVRASVLKSHDRAHQNMKAEQTAIVLCFMMRGTTRARSCCRHWIRTNVIVKRIHPTSVPITSAESQGLVMPPHSSARK